MYVWVLLILGLRVPTSSNLSIFYLHISTQKSIPKTLNLQTDSFRSMTSVLSLRVSNSMCSSEVRNTWNTLHSLCVLDQMGKCACTKIKNYWIYSRIYSDPMYHRSHRLRSNELIITPCSGEIGEMSFGRSKVSFVLQEMPTFDYKAIAMGENMFKPEHRRYSETLFWILH